MKYFFLAYVSGKMAKDMPNDRLNRAKHVPLSDDWQLNNSSLLREKELTCDPSPGGRGETPYDALEDLEPFFKIFYTFVCFSVESLRVKL